MGQFRINSGLLNGCTFPMNSIHFEPPLGAWHPYDGSLNHIDSGSNRFFLINRLWLKHYYQISRYAIWRMVEEIQIQATTVLPVRKLEN